MKSSIIKRRYIFALIFFILSACVKEEFKFDNVKTPGWEPNIAAPLINSRMTLWDILLDKDSSEVIIDENNLILLVYKGQLASQTAENLIFIPDQNCNINFNFSIPAPLNSGDIFTTNFSDNIQFNLTGGQVLDSIYFKAGNISISINTTLNYPADLIIKLPGTKNGVQFIETIPINSPNTFYVIDLTNSKLYLDHSINNNELVVNYTVTLYGDGSPNNSPYDININQSFNNLKYKALFGYFGQFDFSFSEDTVTVKLYTNNIEGIINWYDPKIYLIATNYLGIPINIVFEHIEAVNNLIPSSVIISGPGIPNPWGIFYPSYQQIGQGIPSQIMLDKTNSNIDDAFNIQPKEIKTLISATANPSGPPANNFTLDTSKFSLDVRVELPLIGTAKGFVIQDTFDLKFDENVDNIEWILFKMQTINGFPIDVKIQVYFTDSLYNLIDSLIQPFQQLVESATVKQIEIKITKTRLQNFDKVEYALVRANLETYNSGNTTVKLYADQDIHILIGAQVQLKFD